MAHFFRPSDGPSNVSYDVDGKLAPSSIWRMQIPIGGSRSVVLYLAPHAPTHITIDEQTNNVVIDAIKKAMRVDQGESLMDFMGIGGVWCLANR